MGRSVSYLSRAKRVNYFAWPTLEIYDEEKDVAVDTGEYMDNSEVIDWIVEGIKENFSEFKRVYNSWDDRETQIILEGYGTQIGLSEYGGLATLSIRIDEDSTVGSNMDEDEYEEFLNVTEKWIDENWDQVGKYWNQYRRIGGFSDGSSVYEKVNKENE